MRVTADGKKTAYLASYWEGGKERELTLDMRTPDGRPIPRAKDGRYKYLGTTMQAGWVGAFKHAREGAVAKCESVIALACRVHYDHSRD